MPAAPPDRALRHYSQNGEDLVIDAIFAGQSRGVFVEVGCIDGRRFSNTLALEERGWTGLCVEAHPEYIGSLEGSRPGSVVVHAAVAERDGGTIDFHCNGRGSLSTIDPAMRAEYERRMPEWCTGYEVRSVPLRTISSIIDEAGLDAIDLLSVDVEGTEVSALAGLDLARHTPRVIVIESDRDGTIEPMDAMLLPAGYLRGLAVANNQFYFREPADFLRMAGRTIEGVVTHTRHPLDDGGDATREIEITIPESPLASGEQAGIDQP